MPQVARVLAVLTVALASLVGAQTASATIYWSVNDYSANGGYIAKAHDDGTMADATWVQLSGTSQAQDLDFEDGYLYWTDGTQIGRMKPNGTERNDNFFGAPLSVSADMISVSGTHVYYYFNGGLSSASVLYRKSLTAPYVEEQIASIPFEGCGGNTAFLNDVSVADPYVYFTRNHCNQIGRVGTNGSGLNLKHVSIPTAANGTMIDIDGVAAAGSTLWWSEASTGPASLSKSALNGTSISRGLVTETDPLWALAALPTTVYWGGLGDLAKGKLLSTGLSTQNPLLSVSGGVRAIAITETDVCSSIAGTQFSVPVGFTLVGATCRATAGNNKFTGSNRADVMSGGAGNDKLYGKGGNDTLNGDAGNDTLVGGAGKDTLNGGTGNDTLDARDSKSGDTVSCGKGRDAVLANKGDKIAKDCERRTIVR